MGRTEHHGVDMPLEWFEGVVKATVQMDDRQVWIVADSNVQLSAAEVEEKISFLGKPVSIQVL